MDKKVLPCFDPRMRGKDRLLSSETWKRRAGKRPTTGISSRSMLERYASDNVAASLPFSDHHDPNELPRLPSPSHGDVACLDASTSSILLDLDMEYGGARLMIRDLGGGNKNT